MCCGNINATGQHNYTLLKVYSGKHTAIETSGRLLPSMLSRYQPIDRGQHLLNSNIPLSSLRVSVSAANAHGLCQVTTVHHCYSIVLIHFDDTVSLQYPSNYCGSRLQNFLCSWILIFMPSCCTLLFDTRNGGVYPCIQCLVCSIRYYCTSPHQYSSCHHTKDTNHSANTDENSYIDDFGMNPASFTNRSGYIARYAAADEHSQDDISTGEIVFAGQLCSMRTLTRRIAACHTFRSGTRESCEVLLSKLIMSLAMLMYLQCKQRLCQYSRLLYNCLFLVCRQDISL